MRGSRSPSRFRLPGVSPNFRRVSQSPGRHPSCRAVHLAPAGGCSASLSFHRAFDGADGPGCLVGCAGIHPNSSGLTRRVRVFTRSRRLVSCQSHHRMKSTRAAIHVSPRRDGAQVFVRPVSSGGGRVLPPDPWARIAWRDFRCLPQWGGCGLVPALHVTAGRSPLKQLPGASCVGGNMQKDLGPSRPVELSEGVIA